MLLNQAIVAVQAGNFWLRTSDEVAAILPRGISVVVVLALIASGWLGGHLVHVLGVTRPQPATGQIR